MRIIAFSDSHGMTPRVEKLIRDTHESCGLYLFAGDVLKDIKDIPKMFPDVRIVSVPGNCDYYSTEPNVQLVVEQGKRIILTHGHNHRVNFGNHGLLDLAYQNKADIVVYGHTHKRAVDYENGVYLVNPGSIALPRDGLPPAYAAIDIFPDEKGILISAIDYF